MPLPPSFRLLSYFSATSTLLTLNSLLLLLQKPFSSHVLITRAPNSPIGGEYSFFLKPSQFIPTPSEQFPFSFWLMMRDLLAIFLCVPLQVWYCSQIEADCQNIENVSFR
ncbi:hypothetical protein F5Y13DRAFT_95959 [Hypoxylon sp. FL1857]|nr:hypothetical protein F5Y13DRAFT_95959 [Hypoxylon sp. FL1857]